MASIGSQAKIAELVRAYDEVGIPMKFTPSQAKLLVSTWKRLAEGTPATPSDIAALAVEAGMTADEANDFLVWMSEKNDDGAILGTMGLTQTDWSNIKFVADGIDLHVWCALDSLFLPPLINKTVQVEVLAAMSREPVRFSVGPDSIGHIEPAGAVMTTVVPALPDIANLQAVEEVWGIFCHHSLFFASREEAEDWVATKEGLDISILDLPDAYEVASRSFAGLKNLAH